MSSYPYCSALSSFSRAVSGYLSPSRKGDFVFLKNIVLGNFSVRGVQWLWQFSGGIEINFVTWLTTRRFTIPQLNTHQDLNKVTALDMVGTLTVTPSFSHWGTWIFPWGLFSSSFSATVWVEWTLPAPGMGPDFGLSQLGKPAITCSDWFRMDLDLVLANGRGWFSHLWRAGKGSFPSWIWG